MGMLELLVKLASFGTARICLLIVFYTGFTIQKIPSDSPPWRPKLMNKYMNICIIIAIISALSGGANAYFNQDKIKEANSRFNILDKNYQQEKEEWQNYQKGIEGNITSLKNMLNNTNSVTPQIKDNIKALDSKIMDFRLKSTEDLMKNK